MRKQKVYPESNLATLRFCILIANLACLREIMVLMLIQIQRWLMMPKVWRFVCFISCVIGLLCYALSSSFNLLFGKWMWWKILLYIVFSFFIGLAFLFLKPWERSTSPRLETHMAYLVLMMTSVYSFFFDKEASGKADAYSLVSTAAFAIMSLGLSKLSHCGFEVDLLYFFCAFLVLQLIKVKLWLVIVGAGFTYSLFTLRSYLDTRVYLGLQIQDQVDIEIGSYSQEITSDASQVGSISPHAHTDPVLMIVMPEEFVSPPQNEDLEFLATQTDSLLQEGNIDSGLLLEQSLGCIEALKKENGKAMNAIWKHVEEYLKANVVYEDQIPVPELHQDDNLVMDALPSGIINDLNATLRMMVRTVLKSAVRREWCRVYISWRREFLKECVSMFGLRVKEINMEDDDNIMEIVENWIKASNVAVMVLFPNESRLQDRVFGEYISHGKYALEEVCKELQISLLSFVNTLETWIWSHSPTAFSGFIRKVYITLHALIQKLPHRSLDENGHELMKVGERVCKNLDILLKLQNPTYGFKAPQTTAPDGGLHPFTLEVMNYICDVSLVTVNSVGEGELSLCKHVANITERLETFLEAESKNYNNPTLGYVFIMSNRNFMEREAKLSALETILGEDWLQNNTTKFQQSLQLYQSSWDKILDFLKPDIDDSEPNVAAELMKDKLGSFYDSFDDISNLQAAWFVFDKHLRKQIIKSIENMLLPAYGNFIDRFQHFLGKDAYDHIRYGIRQVEDRVNNLFLVRDEMNPMSVKNKLIRKRRRARKFG